jgi:hypothetical protein
MSNRVRANEPEQIQRYKANLTRCLEFLDGIEYSADHVFTNERLGQLTPMDIYHWLAKIAYGTEDPGPEDNPVHARSSTLEYYKKSISHFVPNQHQPWNTISNTGNPTKSKEIHSLLKAVKRKEVRGLGAPSRSDRAFTLEEYEQCLRIMNAFDDEKKRYLYPAITKFQLHMICRIDDSCYTFRQYLQQSDQFPFALTIRMRWSKNVFEERDAPPQIVLASMNSLHCVHLALAVYLELFLGRGEDGNGGSVYLFNALGCKGPKGMIEKVQTFWREDVLCHPNFHKVKAGNLGSHSVKKRATTRARASGCKKDNVDYRARWKDKARQQDRYTEYELAYPDAEVAGVLCHGGPCEYVLAERCQISNEWILEHVTPNINRVYGNGVAIVLGKALLWGVCAPREDCAIAIPDLIRRRVAEAYSILMPQHQVHDKIDQVIEKKLLVISNHEEALIIKKSLELTNIGVDGEDTFGNGRGGETTALLATHFQKLEDMERKLLESHNSHDVHYATINRRLDCIERNVRRLSMVPFCAAPLQQGASSSAHHHQGTPGSVPCPTAAQEASDELLPASGHNPTERMPTFQASLMPNPRDLFVLWHEYEFGVGGRKPAKEFTSVERGRVKFKYCRRKIIWDCVYRMIRCGHTSQSAIDKIYEVYGRSTNVSTIIKRMREDNRVGGHPALR